MFDGKIFFPETGIPIRNNARINVMFAVALPEPLIVLKVMQNSFSIILDCVIKLIAPEFVSYSNDNLGMVFSRCATISICSISKVKP